MSQDDNNPPTGDHPDEHLQQQEQAERPEPAEPPATPEPVDQVKPTARSKKPWIALGVALALVAGSFGLWMYLPPRLPGSIIGNVYVQSKDGLTNLSVTACQVVDGGQLGPCTTIRDADGKISKYGDFTIGGLKRGVPYAVYASADGSWPTWFSDSGSEGFTQALPTMDDVTKHPIRLITIPAHSAQVYSGGIYLHQKRGITGTITPLDALSKNLDIEICQMYESSITECYSDGLTVDYSTGEYAAVNIDPDHDYTLFASADGYLRTWLGGTTSLNPGFSTYLDDLPASAITKSSASPLRPNQNISLKQGATITGTVSPEIAANRNVYACPITLKNPTDLANTNCGIAATDASGHFSITVPAGATVSLIAQADGFVATYLGGCVGNWLDCHDNPQGDFDDAWKYLVTPVTAPDVGQTLGDQNWKLAKHSTISGTYIGDPGEYAMAFACQFVLNQDNSGNTTLTTTDCKSSNTQDKPGTFGIGTPVDLLGGSDYLDNLQPDTDYIVYTTVYASDGSASTVFVGGCRSHRREDVSYQCLIESGGIIHTPAGGGDVKGLTLDVSK